VAFGDYSEFLNVEHLARGRRGAGGRRGLLRGQNTIGLVAATGSSLRATADRHNGVAEQIANGNLSVDVPDRASPEYLALANWAISEQQPLSLTSVDQHPGERPGRDHRDERDAQAVVSGDRPARPCCRSRS
jgi:hypothetical protein